MRHDPNFVAEAQVVAPDELAQIIDAASPFRPAHSDFEMPGWIWGVMLAGYGIFFAGLVGATVGEASAAFAITISILYTAMFFGTAFVLGNLDGRKVGAFTKSAGGKLQTPAGPMALGAVASQMLVIPIVLGFFGIAIAVISAVVM